MMRKELDATIVSPTLHWKPYPAYKPSGIEWLGEIPSQWQMMRLRFCAKINPTKSEVSLLPRDTTVSFIPMEMLSVGGISLEYTKTLEECSSGYTYFRNSDVITAKITPCFENRKGAVAEGLENGIGFGTTELHVLRANPDLNPKFLFYLTANHSFREIGTGAMYGAGGQKRVPDDFIRDFRHPTPPLDEQRAIAAFLDRETARIDVLIEKKRRQIELLQEKRTALISHAVTKGLDPNAKMKPSGIEWLGEIPADWKIQRIKYCAQLIMGQSPPSDECNEDGRGLPFLQGCAEFGSVSPTPKQFCETPRKTVIASDILISVRAPVGALNIADQQYGIGRGLCAIRASDPVIDRRYCWHLLEALRWQLDIVSSGSTYDAVSAEDVGNIRAIIPSILEQRAIAAFLDRETARIDALIGKIEKSIELLRECRSALISSAVTGKIDVRDQ